MNGEGGKHDDRTREDGTPEVGKPVPEDQKTGELTDETLGKVAGGTLSSVSNVLKTRHDTAKNSISNVR
jgi:hypothetical protein